MTETPSREVTERESAAVAVAPRVTLDSMKAKIAAENYFTAGEAISAIGQPHLPEHHLLTICILTMQNGFMLIGKSAPASAANFNAELGRKFALEDAIRQLWQLEGYALRERLAAPDQRFKRQA